MQNVLKDLRLVGLVALSLVGASRAVADTLTLKSGLTGDIDWTAQASYADATHAPTAGDTVVIPAGMTATLKDSDAASWSLVSSLERVTPEDGAIFAVDVAAAEPKTLGCQISYYSQAVGSGRGKLLKTGTGTLLLARTLSLSPSTGTFYDYQVNFDVQKGAVKLPDGLTTAVNAYLGNLNVGADGVFCPVNWKSGSADRSTYVCALTGSGRIVSENPNREKLCYNGETGKTGTFDGTFEGKVWVCYYGSIDVTQPHPKLKTDATRIYNGATLGFTAASVFGASGNVGGKGTARYIGSSNITVTAGMWLTDAFCVDGGPRGGATWTGGWSVGSDFLMSLTLSGTGSVTSVLSGPMVVGSSYPNAVEHLIKRGSTTWRKVENGSDKFNGAVDVEEGDLEFTSLAERGTLCALGYSTALYSNVANVAVANASKYAVPWAFLLGGDGTEGFLDYVGAKDGICSTRPFAVRSTGGIKSDAAAGVSLDVAQFSAACAGEKTLVLGGENTEDNVARAISDHDHSADGKGVLGVEKRGSGKWCLRGEQTFTGPLVVKEGTLELDNLPVGSPYRYYRFYIKENAFSACTNNTADGYYANMINDDCIRWKNEGHSASYWGTNEFCGVCFKRLHFYDANGNLVVSNLTAASAATPPVARNLGEGRYAFVGDNLPDTLPSGNQAVANLFLATNSQYRGVMRFSKYLKLDDPMTWGCLELRVPDGTPEICGYDLLQYIAQYQSPFAELSGRGIVSWEVHGSADGVTYEKIHEVNSFKFWGGKNGDVPSYWAFDQTNATSFTYSHANGRFYHFSRTTSSTAGATVNPLAQVESVSVLPGATLKVRGAPLELSRLKVDKPGTGRFRNVAFAETGTLFVTADADDEDLFYPIDFEGTTGAANLADWSVNVNGTLKTGWTVSVVEGGVKCARPGCLLIVR